MDAAQNDLNLDLVIHLGTNCAMFILGKYYAKLNICEIYMIALSMYCTLLDDNIPMVISALDPKKIARFVQKK